MAHSNKLGLGTVQFGLSYGISNTGGQTPKEEVKNILDLALKNDISTLDTASAYGNAESVLGEAGLKGFNVVSKFMTPAVGENLSIQLNATLKNLNQNAIYGYLAHRPEEVDAKIWYELEQLKANGFVKKIGFSLNKPSELEALLEKGFIPDVIQVPYNYLDNRFEKLMVELKNNGCEIHTRSAFLQGLFFKNIDTLPNFFEEVKPILSSVQNDNKSVSGSLLKYVLQKPFVDKVVIGVENAGQLQQNLNDIDSGTILPTLAQNISENILMPANWPKA